MNKIGGEYSKEYLESLVKKPGVMNWILKTFGKKNPTAKTFQNLQANEEEKKRMVEGLKYLGLAGGKRKTVKRTLVKQVERNVNALLKKLKRTRKQNRKKINIAKYRFCYTRKH